MGARQGEAVATDDVSRDAPEAARDGAARRGDVLVVTLDDAELPSGLHALHRAAGFGVTSGARLLVVDLSRLGTLSSPTVTALLAAQRRCGQHGRTVVLRGVTR